MYITQLDINLRENIDHVCWRDLAPGTLFAFLDTNTSSLVHYPVYLCLWNVVGHMDWQRRIGMMATESGQIRELNTDHVAIAYRVK